MPHLSRMGSFRPALSSFSSLLCFFFLVLIVTRPLLVNLFLRFSREALRLGLWSLRYINVLRDNRGGMTFEGHELRSRISSALTNMGRSTREAKTSSREYICP